MKQKEQQLFVSVQTLGIELNVQYKKFAMQSEIFHCFVLSLLGHSLITNLFVFISNQKDI